MYQGYLWIPEIQKAIVKKQTSKHKDNVGRRKLMVIIFIRLGYGPLPMILSGSDFPGMPPLRTYHYETGDKRAYVDFNQFEYIDCLKAAIPQLTAQDPKRAGLRGAEDIMILQDEERAHTARRVAAWAEQQRPRRLKLITLPLHSPDLTPHDSGFIAECKRKWHVQVDGTDMPWSQQCELALEIIRNVDPEPYIKQMPLRWKACQLEKGAHIEQRLKQLKKQQAGQDG